MGSSIKETGRPSSRGRTFVRPLDDQHKDMSMKIETSNNYHSSITQGDRGSIEIMSSFQDGSAIVSAFNIQRFACMTKFTGGRSLPVVMVVLDRVDLYA
nr:hypothetical protein CFP56_78769 [Quercus suber]